LVFDFYIAGQTLKPTITYTQYANSTWATNAPSTLSIC
jgi:hypothetical protein